MIVAYLVAFDERGIAELPAADVHDVWPGSHGHPVPGHVAKWVEAHRGAHGVAVVPDVADHMISTHPAVTAHVAVTLTDSEEEALLRHASGRWPLAVVVYGGESPGAPGVDLGEVGAGEVDGETWAWLAAQGLDGDGDPNVYALVCGRDEVPFASGQPNYRAHRDLVLPPDATRDYLAARQLAEVATHVDELVDAAEAGGLDWGRD